MGGSSKQTTGYKYFSNFLLFIGNPIEKVLGINFDKRGWIKPLVDKKNNPLVIGTVDAPNMYGENEGGVVGQIHARYGTANPEPVSFYSEYLAKNDLPPLAYPYQSYLAFKDFYLGNSGYMKEMLLWPKRIYVRNDGSLQWYQEKAGIPDLYTETSGFVQSNLNINAKYTAFEFNIPKEYEFNAVNQEAWNKLWSVNGIVDTNRPLNYPYPISQVWTIEYSSLDSVFIELTVNIMNNDPLVKAEILLNIAGDIDLISIDDWDEDTPQSYGRGQFKRVRAVLPPKPNGKAILSASGKLEAGLVSWHKGQLRWSNPTDGEGWLQNMDAMDINPIHKIREILTDDTAMNKPESDVNNVNFAKAADRIWSERLGVSWSITEKSCLEAIEELCGHIEAGVRVNRQTGLYEMVLFRDDWFKEEDIHALAVNKIKSMSSLEVANADEAINQLNVSYYNRDTIKDSSFSISENASIRNLQGRVNAEEAGFPYFMKQRNAAVVAQWKLKQISTPVWKGTFTTAEYNARKWNRYDLLKLSWPRKWSGEITVRIMKINLGTGTDVSIDFVEVVPYSSQLWSDVVIDEPIDTAPQPPIPCQYEPFEMPYYLAVMALGQRQVDEELSYENNFGLVGVVAEQPQSNSLYAVMMTHNGVEGEEWLRAATINYEPVAELDQIISRTSTNFTVKDSAAISGLPIGTLIKCGSDWIGTPGEWMVFIGIDPYTGVVSVKRGALDSLPQDWGINTNLYFCGNDVAYDQTEYVSGEEVLVSALTTTPSGMLENNGSIAIEMNARAIRPYPPANVKFNGNYFPETHVISNDILLTWAHRNRVQQTGGEIIGWFDNDVTLENGVTYSLVLSTAQDGIIYSASNITLGNYVIPSAVLLQNKAHKLKLWSVREGFESYQIFEHNFFVESVSLVLTATASKDKVVGSTVPAANISVNVDESLEANMRFDGSKITGKTLPNSTITIEIEE